MKKWIAFTMALAMSLTLVGCGGNGGGNTTGRAPSCTLTGLRTICIPTWNAWTRRATTTLRVPSTWISCSARPNPAGKRWKKPTKKFRRVWTCAQRPFGRHYLNDVTNAVNNANTDWDIFQGNRVSNVSSAADQPFLAVVRRKSLCGKGDRRSRRRGGRIQNVAERALDRRVHHR